MKILNKEASIGKVIFIVEGEVTEDQILNKIFTKIFDFQYVRIKRADIEVIDEAYDKYSNPQDEGSQVFVVNAKNSSLTFIDDTNGDASDYLDKVFELLRTKFKIKFKSSRIYYIWDRDRDSNRQGMLKKLLDRLGNALDNEGFDRQGMLLVSYPCVESFIASCAKNKLGDSFDVKVEKGNMLKTQLYTSGIDKDCINADSIVCATQQLIIAMQTLGIDEPNLDDMRVDNLKVFQAQEDHFAQSRTYRLLSLLSIALLDLRLIIDITDIET